LARVMVYQAVKYDPKTDQTVTLPFMGTRKALKLASLTVVEGSGIEFDDSKLDDNWFTRPKFKS